MFHLNQKNLKETENVEKNKTVIEKAFFPLQITKGCRFLYFLWLRNFYAKSQTNFKC